MERGWAAFVACTFAVGCSSSDGETLLTSRDLPVAPHALLLQGDTLYFATDDQVMSLPRRGHAQPTVLASGQLGVVGLSADGQSLYWATPGTWLGDVPNNDGTIASVP